MKNYDQKMKLLEDHHYKKIAHGLNFSDCTTLKGVINGVAKSQTGYQVLVVEQSKYRN